MREFQRDTSEFLEQMRGTGHPVLLTINGKAELGVQDAAAGRVTPLREFESAFRKKRGLPSRPR